MRLRKISVVFVLMPNAMQARFSRLAEVPRKAMLRRAIVVFYVPTYGNEQHHESYQKRAELKQAFFHGRKNTKIIKTWAEGMTLLSNLTKYRFWRSSHQGDGGKFAPHVFERMATMVQGIVNNQPTVVRGL